MLGEGEDDGRRAVDEGDAVLGDEATGLLGVPFGHDDAGGAGVPGCVEDGTEALGGVR